MDWVKQLQSWLINPSNSDQNPNSKQEFIRIAKVGPPSKLTTVGISNGKLRKKASEFYKINKKLDFEEVVDGIDKLWKSFISEAHILSCAILDKYKKHYNDYLWIKILSWINLIDQWISADHLCIDVLKNFPMGESKYLTELQSWTASDNFWKRRLSVVALVKHVKGNKTLTKFLVDQIDKLKEDRNYYVRKSFSWTLREASKSEPEIIANYLLDNVEFFNKTELREASKYLENEVSTQIILSYDQTK